LRRWLAAGLTAALLITVTAYAALVNRPLPQKEKEQPARDKNYAWPMFGGSVHRNLVNLTDHNIPIDFSVEPGKEKHIKWSADLGSRSYAGPVIAGGKVFVGTNNNRPRNPKIKGDKGVLMCFDEASGKFLWQKVYDKLPAGRVVDWPEEGICSTPVAENGQLFYVSNRCEVVCADAKDGKDLWKLDMMKQLGVFPHNLSTCSPLIVGDAIFVCTSNGVDEGHINIPAPHAPSFIAVNKKNAEVLWQNNDPTKNLLDLPKGGAKDRDAVIKKLVNSGKLLMHGQWASPAYAEVNGQGMIIFPGGDGWLHTFDPATGKTLWKFDCNPKDSFYVLGPKATRNDFVCAPVVYEDKLYIGVGQDPEHRVGVGHLWCIDLARALKNGKKNKDHDVSPRDKKFDPEAAVNKDSALAWHYGGANEGKQKIPGRNYIFARTMCTACVHDGLLYMADLGGFLHCLDAKTGQRYWYHDVESEVWSSPYYVDGKVFLGTIDGTLYIFKHGREKNILGQVDIGAKIGATPVVANGVLYVMAVNKLYAIQAK
jgi:outer membrane protein assembly factor BamB